VILVRLVSGQIARIGVADKYERPPGSLKSEPIYGISHSKVNAEPPVFPEPEPAPEPEPEKKPGSGWGSGSGSERALERALQLSFS
jgi:hypothetical protein